MAKKRIRVAVIFGGTSTEHEVSLVSAKAVIDNLDPDKYELIPIKITKENTWVRPKVIKASYKKQLGSGLVSADKSLDTIENIFEDHQIDVIFPVLHGPYGEDGTIQGMLELMRIPYVGCGVTASAVCMDKVIQKNICRDYGIPVPQFFWLSRTHWTDKKEVTLDLIRKQLGDKYPLFVKPANQGSSVGITKAHNEDELIKGIEEAFTRDLKILIEVGVPNTREIECSVLGNNSDPEVSVLGEIIPGHEFYDYEAKYLEDGSQAIIPAKLSEELARKISHTARLAFEILDCHGLSRVDFLVDDKTGEFYLSEVNTMPGFTPISMYPKLWEASGLPYPKLLDRLIELALSRSSARNSLNYSI